MPGPNTTTEVTGQDMGVPPVGRGDISCGTSGDGDLHLPSSEHSRRVHYKQTH